MTSSQLLKESRDGLLAIHKSLIDLERKSYEDLQGVITSGQFLNLLLESPDLEWLRRFSTLIVDIDEMFAQKDGFSEEAVEAHLVAVRELVFMQGPDDDFRARFESSLQQNTEAAAKLHALRRLLEDEAAG